MATFWPKKLCMWHVVSHDCDNSIFYQGERGPLGVNGTQGFQGCPGQRGVKVSWTKFP